MGGKAVAGTKMRFLLVRIDRDGTNLKRYWTLFLCDEKGEIKYGWARKMEGPRS